MTLQTLGEFLESSKGKAWPSNAYVTAPGFKELYVRRTSRILGDAWIDELLDIARIEATTPGEGAFTKLVAHLLGRGIPLYVECVQNERFAKKLEALGFTRTGKEPAPSFFKLPEGETDAQGTPTD